MNRQCSTLSGLSRLHFQQGLVASLALLATLIGGQQYQRWDQRVHHELAVPIHSAAHYPLAAVGKPSAMVVPPLKAAQQEAFSGEPPYQERWVF